MASQVVLGRNASSPDAPPNGYISVYLKTDGIAYLKDENGDEFPLFKGDDLLSTKKCTLSSAELLAGHDSPVELIPAPGAGKAIDVIEVIFFLDFNTRAYTAGSNILWIYSQTPVVGGGEVIALVDAVFLEATQDTIISGTQSAYYLAENAPLMAIISDSNLTDGDSPIKVYITYRIVNL